MNLERTIRDLMSAIRDQKKKPSAFDSVATVKRIEDNGKGKTAWVHFPGGVDETPVRMSVNAKVGDEVQVRVSGGRAWITGNNAAPPTDDAEAIKARNIAKGAQRTANKAGKSAEKAQKQAKSAQETAEKNAVDHVEKQYCLASANSIPSGGSFADIQVTAWSVDLPAFISGDYYWTREVVYYVDETVSAGAPILYSLGNVAAETSLLEHETNAHFFTDSNGAHVTQNDRQDYTSQNSGYSNTFGPQGVLLRYNGKKMSAQTGSGFTIYKSDGESILTAFLGSGISFADDVPFLIGNVSGGSYLRWYKDTSVTPNKWKMHIAADEISFGGVQVATLDDIDDSATYQILVDNYAIVKNSGGSYSVSTVTFSSTKDTASYSGRFIIKTSTDGSTWTTRYTSSSNEASHTYTIPSGVLYIKGELYLAGGTTTLLDTQTVPIISDGTNGTNGTTFTPSVDASGNISWTNDGDKTNPTARNIKGADGADGYTIILTNESHTFAAGNSAAIAGSTTCQVIAFKGGTQVAATIGNITGCPTGMSTSISDNGTTSAYFTVTVTTSLTTTQGELTVPITVDGKSFTKKFSWALSRKGDEGPSSQYMHFYSTNPSGHTDSTGLFVHDNASQYPDTGNGVQVRSSGITIRCGGVVLSSFEGNQATMGSGKAILKYSEDGSAFGLNNSHRVVLAKATDEGSGVRNDATLSSREISTWTNAKPMAFMNTTHMVNGSTKTAKAGMYVWHGNSTATPLYVILQAGNSSGTDPLLADASPGLYISVPMMNVNGADWTNVKSNLDTVVANISDLDTEIGLIASQLDTDTGLVPVTHTVLSSESFNQYTVKDSTKTFTKSGYYPIGIVGHDNGSGDINASTLELTSRSSGSATLSYRYKHIGSNNSRTVTTTVTILWLKEL